MVRTVLASVLALLVLGGCKTTSSQSQSPLPNPVALDVNGNDWTELSGGLVQKDGTTADGKIFVFGMGQGMSRGLQTAGTGPFNIALPSSTGTGGHWANDQLNAQLANGDMLLIWNGYSNTLDEEFKKSEWWNKWPTSDGTAPADVGYPVDRNGIRPAELIWRYVAKDGAWSPR